MSIFFLMNYGWMSSVCWSVSSKPTTVCCHMTKDNNFPSPDDPEFPKFKANYREFLQQRTRFLQPIPIDDSTINRKIHHTYRLQYLKDVILGRALDDATFNVLNSCIIFNQIDIINHVQNHERFLGELVSLFVSPTDEKGKEKAKNQETNSGAAMDIDRTTPNGSPAKAAPNGVSNGNQTSPEAGSSTESEVELDMRRREIILLLQQLCQIGKNVQLPARIPLFRTLVERGVLYAIQWALGHSETSDRQLVCTAGEILSVLLDHHTASVRNHIVNQAIALGQAVGKDRSEKDTFIGPERPKPQPPPKISGSFPETIVQVLCRMLSNSEDLGLQSQFAESLRMLLDVPQGDSTDQHVSRSK